MHPTSPQLSAGTLPHVDEETSNTQVDDAREAMDDVRRLPGGEMTWQRVDAYPGTRLDRDMGAGQDADGWIGEVAEFPEGLTDAVGCGGFMGGNAWGACAECGLGLEDHGA